MKNDHLYLLFYGGVQITLSREEIIFEDLAPWLADRGVTGAGNLKRNPRGMSESGATKQKTVGTGTLQNKAITGPVLTLQASRGARIRAFLLHGVPFVLSVYALLGVGIGRYLSNPTGMNLFVICVLPLGSAIWLYCATLVLFPRVVFYENHITVRSQWGRSRRRHYQEIVHLDVDYETLQLEFGDGGSIGVPRSVIRTESFIRWLAGRGVTAARDFKWEESRSPVRK